MEKFLVEIRIIEPCGRKWNDESSIEVFICANSESEATDWGNKAGRQYVTDIYSLKGRSTEAGGAYLGCWASDAEGWLPIQIESAQVIEVGEYLDPSET